MEELTKVCAYCGKVFAKPPTVSEPYFKKLRKYCSNYCHNKGKDNSQLKPYNFKKGVRNNPAGEFKKGHIPANYKEKDYGYHAVHKWIYNHYKKSGVCSHCGKTNCATQWSNISKEYYRDIKDFEELCYSCHAKLDNRNGALALTRFGKY